MDIIIFPDKKRFPMILFFWVVIFFFFSWSLANSHDNMFPSGNVGNRVYETVLLGVVLFYTTLAAVNYFYVIASPNARLTIDNSGIDDSLTIYSIGRVKWSDIESVDLRNIFNIDLLLIKLKDPKDIIAQQRKWKRRYLNKLFKKWSTPMVISQRVVNYDIKELRSRIQERLHK